MAKTIAVLGVTGNQGGSVAEKFHSMGWNVRGITRSASSPSALSLAAKGIQLVEADIDKPSTLLPAFRGAHVIFAVTDFWAPFFARYAELSKTSDRATGEYSFDLEVKRGESIIDAAAQVLEEEGRLERFVWSTLPSFKELSKGKYDFCYHYDGKAEVSKYLKGKKDLWERSSLLNMGFFYTNLAKMGKLIGLSKDIKTNRYILSKPGRNDTIHPFVDTRDTGLFVDLLVRSPPCQDLLGVSEMSSYKSFMQIWSEVTGKPSESREISVEEADKALPGGVGRESAESTATSAEFGWGEHLVMPKDLDPQLVTTSLRDYIEGEDWESVLIKI